ncbi:MAG: TlpA family protein disulfide reductase [Planctomycetia bacterium]|nr:TlpA family protein disulfide reductase [Planctomycetia bacterium]
MRLGPALAACVLLAGCHPPAPPPRPAPPPPIGPAAGNSVPALSLRDSKGAPFLTSGFVGRKAQLLVFGTTACPMCQGKMSDIQAVHEKRGGQVEVAAVLLSETPEKADKFAADFNATFRMVLDPQNITIALFKLGHYPHFVLVDRRGVIRYSGPELPADAMVDEAAR